MPDNAAVSPSTGGEQFLLLGAQLVEAIVERLRAASSSDGEEDREDGRGEAPPRREFRDDVARLRRLCLALARRNAELARALGACRCWGERPACPECGGDGRPGFFHVDRGAFAAFVAPVMAAEPEPFLGGLFPNAGPGPARAP